MKLKSQKSKVKTTTKNVKLFLVPLLFYFLLFTLFGCTCLKETAKGISGISTKALEDNRKSAIVKNFNYDYFSCYTKTLDILKQIKTYIYLQDIKKHMIAIYVSKQDTTAVGIFFKEKDTSNTQVEVSSPSTYAKEYIADRVFAILEGLPDPVKEP